MICFFQCVCVRLCAFGGVCVLVIGALQFVAVWYISVLHTFDFKVVNSALQEHVCVRFGVVCLCDCVCLCVCVCVCVSVRPSVRPSVDCLSVCLSSAVCLSVFAIVCLCLCLCLCVCRLPLLVCVCVVHHCQT